MDLKALEIEDEMKAKNAEEKQAKKDKKKSKESTDLPEE